MREKFEQRGVPVVAIAQEDTDLASHAKFLNRFKDGPWFTILADLNRQKSTMYDRVTTYVVDARGVVRQVMPQLIRQRAEWEAVLGEVHRLLEETKTESPDGT